MSYLQMLRHAEYPDSLVKSYETLRGMFGQVPKLFDAMNLRPELLEPLVTFINRLMVEEHRLSRTTKELIAGHVSKLNSCDYCVDAHGAMVMAQGFSQEQVQSILDDPQGTDLIDEKTQALLRLAEKATRNAYKVVPKDIQSLRDLGMDDAAILEAIHIISLFNYLNRMADCIGAPVENMQTMVANMN